jgi:hypothetical protein
MAIGLGGLGAWLLGMRNGSLFQMFKSSSRPGKQKASWVRSAMIEDLAARANEAKDVLMRRHQ